MDYLLKTEPSVYSFADLLRDKTTMWDGVSNPVALKHLREMKAGDRVIIYHTGDEKSAVGTGTVVSIEVKDPKNPEVKLKAGEAIAKPKTLAEIKASKALRGMLLTKLSLFGCEKLESLNGLAGMP